MIIQKTHTLINHNFKPRESLEWVKAPKRAQCSGEPDMINP